MINNFYLSYQVIIIDIIYHWNSIGDQALFYCPQLDLVLKSGLRIPCPDNSFLFPSTHLFDFSFTLPGQEPFVQNWTTWHHHSIYKADLPVPQESPNYSNTLYNGRIASYDIFILALLIASLTLVALLCLCLCVLIRNWITQYSI